MTSAPPIADPTVPAAATGSGVAEVDHGPALRRARRRLVAGLLAAAVAVAAAVVGVVHATASPTMTITADFVEAPGLYVGNHVDVLGIPVGTITAIRPGPSFVAVVMSVPRSLRIPATADAVLEAPDVISDRYVGLTPVYRSGPRLGPGATIPLARTAIPQSLDQILGTFDELARALGPSGANRNGAVARLVHELALQLHDNGPSLHATIASLGQAFSSLTGKSSGLTRTLDNLGSLTSALAHADGTYSAFAQTAAAVGQDLAADRQDLGGALTTLGAALAQIASFVQHNGSAITDAVGNLQQTVAALAQDQQSLAKAWDIAPLSFQNFANAIDTQAPGGSALRTVLVPTPDSSTLASEVCGLPAIRGNNLLLNGSSASTLDVACAAAFGLASLPTPPGAPNGPDLTLNALVGGPA